MFDKSTPDVIFLKGDRTEKTAIAGAIVDAGMLLEVTASGTVQANSAAADVNAAPRFADVRFNLGECVTDAVPAGDTVFYFVAEQGAEVVAKLAAGVSVTEASLLESDGAGALQLLTTGKAVARSLETKTSVGVESLTVEVL